MELDLAGRVALVTGASKGIGLAVASRLAAEGCTIHLAARSADALEAARDKLKGHGNPIAVHVADLSEPSTPERLIDACGHLDILVNNAGAIPAGRIDQIDDAAWRKAWDLKVFGYINMTRTALEHFRRRKAGVIVNVIGMAGERPDARYVAGSTGNAALMAFSRAIGAASVDEGVRVVGVNPGPVATDRMVTLLKAKALGSLGDENRWTELLTEYPFGRPCRPEEVADLVAFLASARASYISGTVVTIDGGMSARGGSF
ncbi:MAG: SDR family oxidoreductase [Hyphomicrobiaceae bacterium]|nr:SDR family oxidoreductase [Hyphomicrobiaceae bacterium]